MRLVDGEEIIRILDEEIEWDGDGYYDTDELSCRRIGLQRAKEAVQEAETLNTRSKGLSRWYQGYKKGFDTGYIKGHDDGIALVKGSADNG